MGEAQTDPYFVVQYLPKPVPARQQLILPRQSPQSHAQVDFKRLLSGSQI